MKRGIRFFYERRVISFLMPVRYGRCNVCRSGNVSKANIYLTDFSLIDYPFYIETKGHMPSTQRTRYLALKKAGHDIRFVFQRDNKLSPKSKTRYSDWAEKYGFFYNMGVPDSKWFKGKTNEK